MIGIKVELLGIRSCWGVLHWVPDRLHGGCCVGILKFVCFFTVPYNSAALPCTYINTLILANVFHANKAALKKDDTDFFYVQQWFVYTLNWTLMLSNVWWWPKLVQFPECDAPRWLWSLYSERASFRSTFNDRRAAINCCGKRLNDEIMFTWSCYHHCFSY